MKQNKFYLALFAMVSMILCANLSMGQSIAADSIMSSKDFFKSGGFKTLTGKSKSEDIIVTVKNQTIELGLQMGGHLESGSIRFVVYDPNGKKRTDVSLKRMGNALLHSETTSLSMEANDLPSNNLKVWQEKQTKTSNIEGIFIKSYVNPMPGKWIIKVIPTYVDGRYKILYVQVMK